MRIKVKLDEIIEQMELQFEESRCFLNKNTGEIVTISTEDLRAAEDEDPFDHLSKWEQENRLVALDIVDNFENYVELPTREDINEYDIMEDFCHSLSNQKHQGTLLNAIRGKGAFRRFKDKIIDFEIEDQWYSFRDERYKQIAIKWCEENDLTYIE